MFRPEVGVGDIQNLRTMFNMSQNMALRVGRYFSRRLNAPMSPYVKEQSAMLNKQFEDLFETDTESSGPAVVCVDTEAFLRRIADIREMKLEDVMLIVGIDKGDETVKLSVTLVKINEAGIPRGEAIGDGGFRTSGVKRLLLSGCAAVDETYETINHLMKVFPSKLCRFAVAVDHKMKSIICGLSGGAPMHWCEVCDYNRNDGDEPVVGRAKMRTFESLRTDHAAYQKHVAEYKAYTAPQASTGRPRKRVLKPKPMDYNNVIHAPMPWLPDTGLVIDTITPSGLHLTINIVSRVVFDAIDDSKTEDGRCSRVMTNYVEKQLSLTMFAQRKEWEGGKCLKMIKSRNLKKLLESIKDECKGEASRLYDYYDTLNAFSKIHNCCFGADYDPAAEKHLELFAACYNNLFNSVSRTVHVLLRHVIPFCKRHDCGIGPFIEQAHESVQRDFRLEHHKLHRANTEHPDYCKYLRLAICRYNSLHSGATTHGDDTKTCDDAGNRDDDGSAGDDGSRDDAGSDGDGRGGGQGGSDGAAGEGHPPPAAPDDAPASSEKKDRDDHHHATTTDQVE